MWNTWEAEHWGSFRSAVAIRVLVLAEYILGYVPGYSQSVDSGMYPYPYRV